MGLINIGFASIDHEEFKKAAELIWLTSISNHRNNILRLVMVHLLPSLSIGHATIPKVVRKVDCVQELFLWQQIFHS